MRIFDLIYVNLKAAGLAFFKVSDHNYCGKDDDGTANQHTQEQGIIKIISIPDRIVSRAKQLDFSSQVIQH